MGMHKKFEAVLKAKVALEAIKGEKTAAQISSEYCVHANTGYAMEARIDSAFYRTVYEAQQYHGAAARGAYR